VKPSLALRALPFARALTLQNPWAWAICHAGKPVENRTWAAPESLDWLLIHAGKAHDPDGPGFTKAMGFNVPPAGKLATSAIVAIARLGHVCNSGLRGAHNCCGPWAANGQFHWRLDEDVLVLDRPVPATGRLGLWRPDRRTLDDLETVLREMWAGDLESGERTVIDLRPEVRAALEATP
jgi:hypothetical protein